MSASRGTFLSVSGWSVSSEATISGSEAFFEPETRMLPLSCAPPRMRMRSMSASASDTRQGHAALTLILAGAIAIGGLAGLVALQEEKLRRALVGVDACRQRCRIGELQRHVAFPLRLERRDVDDDAAARVGRLADADHQGVSGDAEVLDGARQGKRVG